MRKLTWLLLAAALMLPGAQAAGQGNTTGLVVTGCGTVPSAFVPGRPGPFTVDVAGYLCGFFAPAPAVSGGITKSSVVLANSTNSTLLKNGAGQVYTVQVFNNSTSIAYLKFYDKATAPTCNSDTIVWQVMIPASASGAGAIAPIELGLPFTLGIGYCVTGGIGPTDNTSVAATTYIVNVGYK